MGRAATLSALVILAGNAAIDWTLGKVPFDHGTFGLIDALDVAVLQFVFAGLPFFALAACVERRRFLWGAALFVTIVLWSYATRQVGEDAQSGFAGGANIGLGFIMIFVPVGVTAVLLGVSHVLKQDKR